MRILQLIVFIFINSLLLNAQDITRVLFIGNSITYFNNMPQTFEAIANSKGDSTVVTMYAPGGTGFINHVNDETVYNHFREGNWDYVVLQPGSNESPGYSEPIDQTLSRARLLKDSILFYNPCAKILYYEISYGVWGNTQANLNSYNTTMDLIRTNLEYLSDSTKLFFAPAGEAIRTAWNTDQTEFLWGGNGDIHPNDKGSYIIACTFYASIFQKESLGTNIINSLTQAEANSYQELADTTVLNNLSSWRINSYNQFTDFTYLTNQLDVNFNSTSLNIDSLHWDFGDGTNSNLITPIHTYNQPGTFNVILRTYKNGCIESKTKEINISLVGIDDKNRITKPSIYPNPFSNKIIIDNINGREVLIYNTLGKEFTGFVSIVKTGKGVEVNTSNLTNGVYVIKLGNYSKIVLKK